MNSISSSIIVPARLVFLMWAVYYVDKLFPGQFGVFGILPRTVHGLIGVFAAPLLHGSVAHLVSNTMPLLILGTVLYMFYDRIASRVFLQCYLLTGGAGLAVRATILSHRSQRVDLRTSFFSYVFRALPA